MKKFFTMAAIALFTLTSCSNDDSTPITNNPGENPTDAVLLKKMITTIETLGTDTSVYNYDAQNRITTITDENGVVVAEYTYDGNKITKIELLNIDGSVSVLETFEYDATGKLTIFKATSYDLPEEFPSTLKKVFTYNEDGTITSVAYNGDEDEQTNLDGTSVMTMSNNNIIKVVETGGFGTGSSTRHLTFDNKNDPFKNVAGYHVKALVAEYGGVNNVTFYDYPNGDLYDNTITYTYNSGNFPLTSASSSPQGGAAAATQYFYE